MREGLPSLRNNSVTKIKIDSRGPLNRNKLLSEIKSWIYIEVKREFTAIKQAQTHNPNILFRRDFIIKNIIGPSSFPPTFSEFSDPGIESHHGMGFFENQKNLCIVWYKYQLTPIIILEVMAVWILWKAGKVLKNLTACNILQARYD